MMTENANVGQGQIDQEQNRATLYNRLIYAYYTIPMAQNKQMKSSKHKLKPIKLKAKAGDEEEVGQKYRQ